MANSYVEYTANGSTNQFDITFDYIDRTHVKVYVDNVEDTTFTFINDNRIQTTSMPANAAVVKVDRQTPINSRLVDFQDGSVLTEADLDKSANQNFYIAQETEDEVASKLGQNNAGVFDAINKRIINVAEPTASSDAATKNYIDTQTTSAATSATNSANSATAAASSATSAATSATTATTKASEASTSASNASTSETNAATSATAASSSATAASNSASAASTSETNAASSASTASTQATNAASSASTASTQATNAANSASAASTSETNAASSASTASTQATNAATSATAAQTAQTAAEAALDSFDDRFLGSKSSDPTLDNDGNALTDGALYFDTTNNVMKVYDLGNTQWKQTTPTSSQQTNIDSVASNATNINTVATNISSVNSFANQYRIGATDPTTSLDAGDLFFNTTSNTLRFYNGSSWADIDTGIQTESDPNAIAFSIALG